MEHFHIITNQTKDPEFQVTNQIKDYLEAHGKMCTVCAERHIDKNLVQQGADCVLVLGGDGTIIAAAKKCAQYKNILVGKHYEDIRKI